MRAFLIIFLLLPVITFSQRLETSGKKIIDSNGDEVILRGMGLGGWMLMEGYMMQSSDVADTQHEFRARLEDLMGVDKTDEFFNAWLDNHVTKKDVDSLAAWGYNSIRLPMHYNLFTLPIEDEPIAGENTWLTKGFELTDNLLNWCKENEIYLILDLHGAPGGQGENAAISDYDPTKPSLWESEENRGKTVALWKKLAERYKEEDWIGGYDLINETNWYKDDMGSNNALLRQLMVEITTAIRSAGDNHIVFIEGNSWANDFNGMTPPWDNNMAYSFHKYWSRNDQGSIQWVLDIREQHNVPLWMGEAGENSNVWFTEAISLFEENGIGWSWWPMKRIETIVSPYAIEFTDGYKEVLRYWRGEIAKPSIDDAYDAMLELALNANSANCEYQKDVHDAKIRQPHTDETLPFTQHTLPGRINMSDFDLGKIGFSYNDADFANYSLSTGSFQAWNNGWAYRNDAVDIEKNDNLENGNGYNIGFVNKGEWINYTIDISASGVYDLTVWLASISSNGQFHFSLDGEAITAIQHVTKTAGWTDYQPHLINDVYLQEGNHVLTFSIDNSIAFNILSTDFELSPASTEVPFQLLFATTNTTETSIEITANYAFKEEEYDGYLDDFEVLSNGVEVDIKSIGYSGGSNARTLILELAEALLYSDEIVVNYTGNTIKSDGGLGLEMKSDLEVLNELVTRHILPGKLEAEDFYKMEGVELEESTDIGGGSNIGFLNVGDYLDYLIHVPVEGEYPLDFRVAAQNKTGKVGLYLIDAETEIFLEEYSLPSTGGWQTWETMNGSITLPEGNHTLRVKIVIGDFNLNWMNFKDVILGIDESPIKENGFYPNPASGKINVVNPAFNHYSIVSIQGKTIESDKILANRQLDISHLRTGHYFLVLEQQERYCMRTFKLIVQ